MLLTLTALILLGAAPTPPEVPAAKEPTGPSAPTAPAPGGPKAVAAEEAAQTTLSPPPLETASQTSAPAEGRATKQKARAGKSSADAGASEDPTVPPSLTKKGLCGELTKTGKELAAARRKLDEDRKELDAERTALERLKAEIADARIQLRAETERLESLLAKREPGADGKAETSVEPEKPKAAPPAPKPQDLDGLAKTMKSMKPEAAAILLMKSEPALGAAVLRRMKPADAGAILDRVRPDFAAELVALMATIPAPPPSKAGRL